MLRLSPYLYKEHQWSDLNSMPFYLPLLQCHRGYLKKGATENTIGSLQAAFEQGYKMAETDLRLNRNGEVVLSHDLLTPEKENEDLSTLLATLEVLTPKHFLNLEIKNETKTNFSLEEKIIAVLKNHPKRFQILFSSFNPFSLAWMGKLLPEIPRGLLVTQAEEPGNSFFLKEMSFLPLVKPHFLHVRWEDLDHYKDVPPERKVIWTLNDLNHAQTLVDCNKVRSIITDSILPSQLKKA